MSMLFFPFFDKLPNKYDNSNHMFVSVDLKIQIIILIETNIGIYELRKK